MNFPEEKHRYSFCTQELQPENDDLPEGLPEPAPAAALPAAAPPAAAPPAAAPPAAAPPAAAPPAAAPPAAAPADMETYGAMPKRKARAPGKAAKMVTQEVQMVTQEVQTDITGHTSGNGMPYPGGSHVQVL